LYTGMQQGDNGQSLMLGGCDRDGKDASNDLTVLCLTASLELRRIDPKINLRVNRDTPLEVYEYCTKLTKQGLGFPQYANDDVVIPGLVKLGYDLEDARNYTVAACWGVHHPRRGHGHSQHRRHAAGGSGARGLRGRAGDCQGL
ncbi:MAG: pyruvate formate lyase family protein, partial [Christensenellales bacterium]